MHPQLALSAARQRIADLHRAADHDRLVHTATTAASSHAARAPRHAVPAPGTPPARQSRSCAGSAAVFRSLVHGRLEPREDQAGDCK
jgi:hypothetical protein